MPAARNTTLALLALALCVAPSRPAAAQAVPPPIAGLTYDAAGNLYLYTDPVTGNRRGPDPNLTYAANPGGTYIVTSSNFNHTQYADTPVSLTDHTYATTVDALLGGGSVFDMTFALPYADPTVQAAVAQADALLTADGAAFGAPALASSLLTSLGSQTSTVQTGETNDSIGLRNDGSLLGPVISTASFGPGTIGPVSGPPGNGSIEDPLHPLYFFVDAGQTDVNITSGVTFTIAQTVTTTTTDLLTQKYTITGAPRAANAVPEPSSFALLALGLLPAALRARKRQKAA